MRILKGDKLMDIAIIDADLIRKKKHRFPNLACMKLSSYYKHLGHKVSLELSYDNVENYDKVFISKVFTDTVVPKEILNLSWVEHGGTGFYYDKATPLPYEIEHIMPDYHLYDDWVNMKLNEGVKPNELQYYTDYSIGFTTRGCIRQCSFCVNKNYKQSIRHSPVSEFIDPNRKYICLLDDNVFSCRDWKAIFNELNSTGKKFQFKQGLDERLLTDEKCEMLFNSNWVGGYIFAFDNIKDSKIIVKKLQLIRRHTSIIPTFYTFCAYNHDVPGEYDEDFWIKDVEDLFERIRILLSYQCLPYVMRYADYKLSPYKGIYITLARWCNQASFVKKKSFREFCQANGENSASMRYLKKFEEKSPEIAKRYFDMKWGEI